MALIKNPAAQTIPATSGVVADQAAQAAPWEETHAEIETSYEPTGYAPVAAPTGYAPEVTNAPATVSNSAVASVSQAALGTLAAQGFEGLAFDWRSFPTISLKAEGIFQDIDNKEYGKEFMCRVRGSKTRYVYRANPVVDNKRDTAFSYDRIATQDGVLIADKKREWEAAGKMVEEKTYLEAMVEMVAPGEAHDGEYRILSISPTSISRFSGHVAKAAVFGGGDPGNVITKVFTTKVLKVANPFWSWQFELVKN